MRRRLRTHSRRTGAFAVLACVSLLAAACGGTSSDDAADNGEDGAALESAGLTAEDGESGLDEAGEPVRGGTLTYGQEADTNGGFCLPEAQLAISGIMVARAIYDTLTVPNAEGEFVPYLAESVEPNEDFTEWDITVREGVQFHDGSDLDAEVLKNNIDAFRGEYEGRASLLFAFLLTNVTDTEVVDDLTVRVTLEVPWPAFPAYLFSTGRAGIMAQSQLDDADTCAQNPVGTGPFSFVNWDPNEIFQAERNENYWQIAPDGEPYPYVDAIEFVPIPDGQTRNAALEAGGIDLMHTSNAADIGTRWRDQRDAGEVNLLASQAFGEVAFGQLNQTQPPFDDVRMRRAMAHAIDIEQLNRVIGEDVPTIASGPYAPDSPAYLEDAGYPEYDPEEASRLVEEYVADGGDPSFTLSSTTDPSVRRAAEIVQQQVQAAGATMDINELDQAALINAAIGRSYQAMLFRNYPGGDPDQLYVWFHSGDPGGELTNPVNFAGVNDPEVDRLLDEGRSETDLDARPEIYQELNRRMGEQVHGLWFTYTVWAIVEGANVHGVLGPPLPGEDISEPGEAETDDAARQPNRGLADGHSLLGLWIAQ
jgi:peptide/nickel transport system substrate-binding protein